MKEFDKNKNASEKKAKRHNIYINTSRFLKILESLATIIIGAVSIYVMSSQRNLQEETIRMQKHEHQPKFTVDITKSFLNDSINLEYDNISISNIGEKFVHCATPEIITYIDVEYIEYQIPKNQHYPFHIPYTDYFDLKPTIRLQGEIAVGHENYDVAKHLSKLFSTRLPPPPDCRGVFTFEIIHMIHISYQDIYNEYHDVYFKGSNEIEESMFKEYYDDSTLEEGDIFDLSSLKKGNFFNYKLTKLDYNQLFDYIRLLKESSTNVKQ